MFETPHESAGHGASAFRKWFEADVHRAPSSNSEWNLRAHVSTAGEWQRTSPHFFAKKSPTNVRREQRSNQLELSKIFEGLVSKWEKETSFHSAPVVKFHHPAYKAIISLGKEVLPLIFDRLEHGGKNWAYALREITGVDPASHTDNHRAAVMAWLEWWGHQKSVK